MFRRGLRTLTGVAGAVALLAVTAGPASAFYLPPYDPVKHRPIVPDTTSMALNPTADWSPDPESLPPLIAAVDNTGVVSIKGVAPLYGSPKPGSTNGSIVSTPSGQGYWVVDSVTGNVQAFGDAWPAPSFQTVGFAKKGLPFITDVQATPDGHGLIAVDTYNHVWTLGTAKSYGDATHSPTCPGTYGKQAVALRLNQDATGYYILDSGGEVWSFGSNVPTYGNGCSFDTLGFVSMAMTQDGGGYWLADLQGNILPFGDAVGGRRTGAPPSHQPKDPVTSMVGTTRDTTTMWLITERGVVTTYPLAPAEPGAGCRLPWIHSCRWPFSSQPPWCPTPDGVQGVTLPCPAKRP